MRNKTKITLPNRQDGCGLIAAAMVKNKRDVARKLQQDTLKQLIAKGAEIALELDARRKQFQAACDEVALRELGFEIFDEADMYELLDLPWVGVTPEDFVKNRFGADYARLQTEEENRKNA